MTLGNGNKSWHGDAQICQAGNCYGSECEISAICTSMNRENVLYPAGYYQLGKWADSFELILSENLPWTQKTAAMYSFQSQMARTICFWMKCASDVFLGSILYLANNYGLPVVALGGGFVKSTGIVIMPNGEELSFDTAVLHDSSWHHVCIIFGESAASNETRCSLFIDGFSVVSTSKACSSDALPVAGQMFIGRGMDAVSPLRYNDSQSTWIYDHGMLLSTEAKSIFSSPYAGNIGNFSFYAKPLSAVEIRNTLFSCLNVDRMSPLFISSQQNLPHKEKGIVVQILGDIHKYYQSQPCFAVRGLPFVVLVFCDLMK